MKKKIVSYFIAPENLASEELQAERKKFCDSCHFRKPSTNSCGKFIIGQTVLYKGEVKKLCGCYLPELRACKHLKCSVDKW